MSSPATCAHLHLVVGSLALPVLALRGEEALSEAFCLNLEVLADAGLDLTELLVEPVRLSLRGNDESVRQIAGILTELEDIGLHTDGRRRLALRLESALARLRRQTDTRIILNRSAVDIVRQTLLGHGFAENRLRFHLSRHYPVRPYTLQAQETDYAFVQRLLARAGIFFWSSAESGEEVLHFSDHNSHCSFLERGALEYLPPDGMPATDSAAQARVGFGRLEVLQSMTTGRFQVHGVNDQLPSRRLTAAAAAQDVPESATAAAAMHFATGVRHPAEAEAEARLRAERARVEAWQLSASGDVADLAPGAVLSLDASRFGPGYSGDYLITGLRHRASQYAGQAVARADLPYRVEALLIRRETPYRPAIGAHPELPATFTARIESAGSQPQLDEQGRYRVRAIFDRSATAHAEASAPLRRLSPHGGPSGKSPSGWHTPLNDGAEVLLSCLNGDPDRPMIVGTLPNPSNPSPVTSANPHQNLLRTAAGNQLCLDDHREQSAITLGTFAGHNMLQLDAAALGHNVRLASARGAMQWQAKKTLEIRSGNTLTERVGGDRIQSVENLHRTVTQSAEIHHQAATDYRQQAGKNLQMRAQKNLEIRSGKLLRIDVEEGQQVTVKGPRATFTVRDGNLHLQVARDLRIEGEGGGDITFGQSGGGFVIKADGTVQLFGNQVMLQAAGGVALNGQVNHQIGRAAAMPEGAGARPLSPHPISALARDEPPLETKDLQINLNDFYGNALSGHFESITGLKWRLVSDCGEERAGVVDAETIAVTGLHVKETIHFEIENLDLDLS